MLQQPLARRVAGAARYAAAGEALPGALPLSSMRRRARGLRAAPFQPMERQMPGGPSGRGFYRSPRPPRRAVSDEWKAPPKRRRLATNSNPSAQAARVAATA